MKFLIDAQLPRRLAMKNSLIGNRVGSFLLFHAASPCDSATEWRQDVATGVSPWNKLNHCDSVPEGRQERVMWHSCRPVGTCDDQVSRTTGSRPWLQHAVPLGLNRRLKSSRQKYAVTTKQILAERDREAAQLDAFLTELGYE